MEFPLSTWVHFSIKTFQIFLQLQIQGEYLPELPESNREHVETRPLGQYISRTYLARRSGRTLPVTQTTFSPPAFQH